MLAPPVHAILLYDRLDMGMVQSRSMLQPLTNGVPYHPEFNAGVTEGASTMSEESGGMNGNGTAIGVAAVAAGVVGTLASSLFSRKESRQERARRQVEQRLSVIEANTNQALDHLTKAVDGLNIQRPAGSKRARRQAQKLGKTATRAAERAAQSTRSRIAELDREAMRLQSIEKANQLGSDGSRRARELAIILNDRTSHLLADNRVNLPEWRKRTSRSVSDVAGKGSALIHQAIDAAPDVRDNVSARTTEAASKGSDVVHQALDRAPAVMDRASKSGHDTFERARDLAHQARAHAPDVVESVSSQVSAALHSAQHQAKPVLKDATTLASRLMEGAKEAGSQASESLLPDVQHRVDAVADRAKSQSQVTASTITALGSSAADKLVHASDAIEQQSKAAATAAGRGTKDGGALVLWSIAAAGIVYFTFLDEEQRRKAKEAGQRIYAEAKEVYRDIRGYDEEFK